MSTVFELGRWKRFEGKDDQKPANWLDEVPPPYAQKDDTAYEPAALAGRLPHRMEPDQAHAWLAAALDLGRFSVDTLLSGGRAVLVDVRRKGDVRVILSWVVGTQHVGTRNEGKIVTEALGFVTVSEEQAERVCRLIARDVSAVDPAQAEIEAAWHRAHLEPDQVAKRREAFLKEHGLDDASVAQQRKNVAAAVRHRLETEAKKKP